MPTTKPVVLQDHAYSGRKDVSVDFSQDKMLTEQHHARSCDINTIMAKYLKTGVLDHVSKYAGTYGDVSQADYQKSMNLIKSVESEFEDLPAYVRDEFENDASQYLEAMQSDEGVAKLQAIRPPGERYEKTGEPSPQPPEQPQEEIAPDPQGG